MATNGDKKRRRKARLFARQNGKCYWCKNDMVIIPTVGNEKTFPKNLATLDHLFDKFHPSRRANSRGKERTVLACWQCNFNRCVESQAAQTLEELHRRAGQRPKDAKPQWQWFHDLRAYSRSMGSTNHQCGCLECIEIQKNNVQISKRPKELVCKTSGYAFAGSNPSSAHQSRV